MCLVVKEKIHALKDTAISTIHMKDRGQKVERGTKSNTDSVSYTECYLACLHNNWCPRRMVQKITWRNKDWKFSKFGKSYL